MRENIGPLFPAFSRNSALLIFKIRKPRYEFPKTPVLMG
jgi:hypothetical protein